MSVSSHFDPLPSYIGEYRIDCLLQHGGSSVVYLGNHPITKEPIAIKVLKKGLLEDPSAEARFLHEAQVIESMNHPNIIKMFGHGTWEGGIYIAMEFVQGISLRELILQQAMSLRRAIEIGLQIAHAVTHLHAQGIVHRDLKPENVMLTAQGGIKLIDFGMAKFYSTQEGPRKMMGTPSYMSPEQRKNPQIASFPSDIFSLGVMLYELILGRLCYGSLQLSLMPRGFQGVLAKMLQPKPEDRYEDIVDVVQVLSRYLGSEELKKDMRGSDYIGELNDELKKTQAKLLPKILPQWPAIKLGFASNSNMALSAVCYDFFEKKPNIYSIVMGESLATGVEGLLEIAMLRGMVRALSRSIQDPQELVRELNDLLVEIGAEQAFSFALLTLMPQEQCYSFISCGYNALWQVPVGGNTPRRITSNNVALGIQEGVSFVAVDANWAIGDNLVLHTFQAGSAKDIEQIEKDEQNFMEALIRHLHLSPEKQVEGMFRNITSKEQKGLLQKLVTIVSIEHVGVYAR